MRSTRSLLFALLCIVPTFTNAQPPSNDNVPLFADESGNPYIMQHVTAPRGSLILWDSRTVHWNQHPSKDRPNTDNPRVRMVGYLCYVPKARLTDEGRGTRIKAFELGVSTGHNPVYPELKYTKDHIWEGFESYLEDPGYIQPKINLTELGESLLGL